MRPRLTETERYYAAQLAVGVGAKCHVCGTDNAWALIRDSDPMTCRGCDRLADGKSVFDLHHIAGRHNWDFAIPVHVNSHAVLSARQYAWGSEVLRNPTRKPLIRLSAMIVGLWQTAEGIVGDQPEMAIGLLVILVILICAIFVAVQATTQYKSANEVPGKVE
jgi:hypothetical protein